MSAEMLRTATALVVDSGVGASAADDDSLAWLRAAGAHMRVVDRAVVECVAAVVRRGVFAERGYRDVVGAVGELLGVDRREARLRVRAAERVADRIGLDGAVLAPLLPATAAGFGAGQLGLRHVDVIAAVLDSASARRLAVDVWAGAEQQLAEQAARLTPARLAAWGQELVEILDADGAVPEDDPPPPADELLITRHRDGTGRLQGRFGDPALFAAITTAIDAAAAPRDGDDRRPIGRRLAEALAEVCAQMLDQGRLPEAGGSRPQLVVHIDLDDLQGRARAAVWDTGGVCDAAALRRLACDAAVIPLVMGGAGQPLDIGRATRTIPDGLRRAVLARDRGCAHPGCDRPPSWTEIHHVLPWAQGGATAIPNLVALCRVHHRQTHTSGWEIRMVAGMPEFRPPAWIDPTRTPRRRPPPWRSTSATSPTPGASPTPVMSPSRARSSTTVMSPTPATSSTPVASPAAGASPAPVALSTAGVPSALAAQSTSIDGVDLIDAFSNQPGSSGSSPASDWTLAGHV